MTQTLPLLPLRDIVVFPQMIVPLFVGRERSVGALEAAMAGDKTDAGLADFAGKTLPTLNKHAEHVVALVK